MSVDTPPETKSQESLPSLRREALLPNERNRGLGTVAVVCTMAGVASGLALATTLMAMQVADSMSVRECPYRVIAADVQTYSLPAEGQPYLGVTYVGVNEVRKVLADSPAALLDIRPGDHIVSVDGAPLRGEHELQRRIGAMYPGAQPTLVVERHGTYHTVRPTLAPFPPQY